MAVNNFLVFDETNTNILSDSEYLSDGERKNGVSQGIARSKSMNKVLRNATTMTSAIGQLIADSGIDATENISTLKTALQKLFLASEDTTVFQGYQFKIGGADFQYNNPVDFGIPGIKAPEGEGQTKKDQLIIVTPKEESAAEYRRCGIRAIEQLNGRLTFAADIVPDFYTVLDVYVLFCDLKLFISA